MPRYVRGWEYHFRRSGNSEPCWIRIITEWCVYIILWDMSLKIRSQYDNCRVWLRNNYKKKNIDMKVRQIIYSSTIIVLGFIQSAPAFICLASTIILLNVLGILYGILLVYIWSSTEKGKWYFRELWRSTLRLENFILPGVWEIWQVRKLCLETFS